MVASLAFLPSLSRSPVGSLALKTGTALGELVGKVRAVGKDDIWSSENLYRHLERLLTILPKSVGSRDFRLDTLILGSVYQNEAAARAWIDALFFPRFRDHSAG